MAELSPITDYTTLKAAVIAMADRSDTEFSDSVPVFIQRAEKAIFSHLRCPGNEKNIAFLASERDNTVRVQIPDDYLEARWILFGDNLLQRVTDQRLLTLTAQDDTAGTPQYFARVNDSLYFYPQAAENQNVVLQYYEDQGPLSATVTSTRMLEINPFMYLYGALMEGARFTRDAQMFGEWKEAFEGEIARMNAQGYDNEAQGSTIVVSDLTGGMNTW